MYRLLMLLAVSLLVGCASSPSDSRYQEETANTLLMAEESYRHGLWSEAESYYQELVDENPELYQAWFRLGNIYARSGQLDAAVTMYERCLELDPEQARGWYNLSVVRARQSLQLAMQAQQRFVGSSPAEAQQFSDFRDRMASALTGNSGKGTR